MRFLINLFQNHYSFIVTLYLVLIQTRKALPITRRTAGTSSFFPSTSRLTVSCFYTTARSTSSRNFYISTRRSTPDYFLKPIQSNTRMYTTTSSTSSDVILDLTNVSSMIVQEEKERQESFNLAFQLKVALAKARHVTTEEEKNNLEAVVTQAMAKDPIKRPPSLSFAIQDHIRFQLFSHFLLTSKTEDDGWNLVLSPLHRVLQFSSSCHQSSQDEDYIMGLMGLTQDLAKHAIHCGTNRDMTSVKKARNVVRDILEYLMQFDFRNGLLRRKYDGVKYSLKTCEQVLYELSVTSTTTVEEETKEERPEKKFKSTPTAIETELNGIKKRMEQFDEVRESLIKRCRDGQKKAKQAIYAIHRGDVPKAKQLLKDSLHIIKQDLIPIVTSEPSLRFGSSLGGVLEEYVEAKLFYTWRISDEKDGVVVLPKKCSTTVLKMEQLDLPISIEEYLGGLADLTGEVGRYAVERGTVRDTVGVQHCLDTNQAILYALQTLERPCSKIGKKMDPLYRSVEKLERILYELSLVNANTGRKNFLPLSNDDGEEQNSNTTSNY